MTQEFFITNRKRLIEQAKGGVYAFTAYSQMQRGNDAAFKFDQEANFWWLTGIEEADWWLILDGTRGKSWLVSPSLSDSHVIFDGSLSAEAALKISGVDAVVNNDEGRKILADMATRHSIISAIGDMPYAEYYDFTFNPAQKKLWKILSRTFNEVQDCQLNLAKLRAIKQPEEITAIKKAIKLTIQGFETVKANLSNYKYEYEIEADFSYVFRKNGARGHAYDPIVAAGKNACTLHYDHNTDRLKAKDLVLMDIGAQVGIYPADITRTYSLSQPTARQQEVFDAVESAHKEIIKLLAPGVSVQGYHEDVDQIMMSAIESLGLMKDKDSYRKYFPHAISHGLGVDVHDSLGRPVEFKSGMILTVEPGIYIPEEGIGIRIEDDILITDKGHQNLSSALSTRL